MNDESAQHDIARLEERIAELAQAIDRCNKIAIAARIAITGGVLWFLLVLVWILPFDLTAFVGAVAALLGGVVLLGSNKTTWEQTEEALRAAEAERSRLIDALRFRVVGGRDVTLH
jgi:hypothetical protein